jgi:hypothetical protein
MVLYAVAKRHVVLNCSWEQTDTDFGFRLRLKSSTEWRWEACSKSSPNPKTNLTAQKSRNESKIVLKTMIGSTDANASGTLPLLLITGHSKITDEPLKIHNAHFYLEEAHNQYSMKVYEMLV